MFFVIPLQLIYWSMVPTCARYRRCSVIPILQQQKSTPISAEQEFRNYIKSITHTLEESGKSVLLFEGEMAKYVLIKTKDNSSIFLLELAQHLVGRNHTIKFFFVQCKPDSDANMHISILSNNDRINFFIDPDENALIDAITSWADKVLCY